MIFQYCSRQIQFSRTFKESPLNSSTFQACANPDTVMQTTPAHFFKYCQVKTHVQTACEIPDLNMGFCSSDNGFEQKCALIFMQE